jgi:glycosyltransferase involved in cell wall biosynthesis
VHVSEPVSVVIPTYNRAILLRQAVESVLAAVEPHDEIIVMDDGSTDDTPTVMKEYAGRVRYFTLPNRGAGATRNAGIAACQHDLIAFADSDDEWLPNRIALQRPLMESNRSLNFVFSDFGQILPDGRREMSCIRLWSGDDRTWTEILGPERRWSVITGLPAAGTDPAVHTGSIYARELGANYINVNTLLVRRSLVGDALRFAEDLPTYEDWECFARIAQTGRCAFVAAATAMQRSHDGPRLTDASRLKQLGARIRIIERIWLLDEDFNQGAGARAVNSTLGELRRQRARLLLLAGRKREAGQDLVLVDHAPLERAAQYLPSGLLRCVPLALRALRRRV